MHLWLNGQSFHGDALSTVEGAFGSSPQRCCAACVQNRSGSAAALMAGLSARDYGGGLSTNGHSAAVSAVGFRLGMLAASGWEKRGTQDVALTKDDGFDEDARHLCVSGTLVFLLSRGSGASCRHHG